MKGNEFGYQLALLHFAADPTSGERVSAGLIAYGNHELIFWGVRNTGRLRAMYPGVTHERFIRMIDGVAAGIYRLSLSDPRGRNMTPLLELALADAGPCFFWSEIQYGITDDLSRAVKRAYHEYIGRHEVAA